MGIHNKTKMKLFIIAAVLIASVMGDSDSEAEAKPWLAYSNYGAYGAYPYAGVYGAGVYGAGYNGYALGHRVIGKRSAASYGAYPYAGVYGAGYNGYALGGYRYLGKRSADSEPEAKPWLAYGYNGYNNYFGARY